MDKQVIIAVNREYGAGGQEIAAKLAERFQIKLYDNRFMIENAHQSGMSAKELEKYDEKARNPLFSRKVRDFDSSNEGVLAENQFQFLKNRMNEGDSFVVLGHCGDIVFREHDKKLISVFVTSEIEKRVPFVMERDNLSEKDAKAMITKMDKRRRQYHDSHTDHLGWEDARAYDLCIDALKIGIDNAVDVVVDYIEKVQKSI